MDSIGILARTTYFKFIANWTFKGQLISKCIFGIFNPPKKQFDFTKGQLISKCLFGVIVWTKIPTKFFPEFLP